MPVVTGCRRAARANGWAGAKRRPANSEGTSSGPPRPGLAARGRRRPARLAVARAKGRGVGQYGGRWRPGVVGERPRGRGGSDRPAGLGASRGIQACPPGRRRGLCPAAVPRALERAVQVTGARRYGTWGRVLPRPAVPRLRAAGGKAQGLGGCGGDGSRAAAALGWREGCPVFLQYQLNRARGSALGEVRTSSCTAGHWWVGVGSEWGPQQVSALAEYPGAEVPDFLLVRYQNGS